MNVPPMQPRDGRPAGDRFEVTLRDTLAAAALSGLLAQGDDGSFSEDSYARSAYRWADAMLRERERTNHDAAPEACAQQSTREPERSLLAPSESVERGLPRTGNTKEPFGWLVKCVQTDQEWYCKVKPSDTSSYPRTVVPLYRHPQPTLTAEEREAIYRAEARLRAAYVPDGETAATLRKLLERLK